MENNQVAQDNQEFKWHIISLDCNNSYKVKSMIEEGIIALGMEDNFDKIIILSSHCGDGFYNGGLLSGYGIIRCKLTPEIFYLITSLDYVYNLLETASKGKSKEYKDIVAVLSELEVCNLIKLCLIKGVGLCIGDSVRFKEGVFNNFKGKVISVKDKEVFVEIGVMGRLIKVSAEVDKLEKIK